MEWPVQVDLSASAVPVSTPFSGVAQQRVWKSFERPQLRLVALAAHVDHDPLTPAHRTVVTLTQFH